MDGHFRILILAKGSTKVKILDICTRIIFSVCAYCVVDINFVVVKSVVCVVKSSIYLMRFPTTSKKTWFGSSFWGW